MAPELAARRAGRLMLEEIDRCGAAGISFAIETTLAGTLRFAVSPSVLRREVMRFRLR
jgi:predicted ABC-type ATPase